VCKLDGTFRPGHGTGGTFRFVEGAGKLYQIWPATDERGLQRIYFDSPRPRNVAATYGGDSRGRFEPDGTLIVDTVGFNGNTWLDMAGHPASDQLHVIERYSRPNFGNLMNHITIEDPVMYSKPWDIRMNTPILDDGNSELMEYICTENERDAKHLDNLKK